MAVPSLQGSKGTLYMYDFSLNAPCIKRDLYIRGNYTIKKPYQQILHEVVGRGLVNNVAIVREP
jgi:hypothetical protein